MTNICTKLRVKSSRLRLCRSILSNN